MPYSYLPEINACLNSLATICILLGIFFIKRGNQKAHIISMVFALTASAVFLFCYLSYHHYLWDSLELRGMKFTYEGAGGWVKKGYYLLLISHVIGAMINLPMIIMTVVPALRSRFDRHKAIARFAYPLWLYVSVTGVMVYLLVYRIFPSDQLPLLRGL